MALWVVYKRQRSASSERALLRDGAVQVDGVEVQRDIAFQNACTERVGLHVPEQGTLNVVALATIGNSAKGWDVERATLLSATSRHRLIEGDRIRHGGQIEATSLIGQGTCLRFSLP